MRTLILTTDAFGRLGGIAQYNRDLVESLCSAPSCETVVVLPRNLDSPITQTLPARLDYVTSGVGGKLRYIFAVLRTAIRYRRFECVVCGHINLLPIAWGISVFTRSRLVLLIYGIDVWKPQFGKLGIWLTHQIDLIVSISEITLEKMAAWSARADTAILPCAVDLKKYEPGPAPAALIAKYRTTGRKVLLTTARLDASERYKGLDETLEAMPKLLEKRPDLVYIIAGGGSDRPRLEAKAAKLNISGQVRFAGHVSDDEKIGLYRLADAFVMPGRGEGFGIVYLEALACGTPAIGSKLDGSREALRQGLLGPLVDPNNPTELITAIQTTLASAEKCIPDGLDYFSIDRFRERTHSIFERFSEKRANLNL